jgi:hypothetical protein
VSAIAGYVVWDEKYGLTYRGRIYDTEAKAEEVRADIVWHSRARYRVRPVLLAATEELVAARALASLAASRPLPGGETP